MTATASASDLPLYDPRLLSAQLVARVIKDNLPLGEPPAGLSAADRSLVQELGHGTLRWYFQLEWLLARLLSRPLKPGEYEVRALLLLGLYQLLHTRIPPYAAVAATVAASRPLRKPWAAGLINAVLRQFQRTQRAGLLAELERSAPASAHAHPAWLYEQIQADWPHDWEVIINANNSRPPQVLRVNLQRSSRADYLAQLQAAAIAASAVPFTPAGVALAEPQPVMRLPGFAQGLIAVQDGAAQLAAALLDAQPGQRVLDACAAPGGKTCHLLEEESSLRLVAVDQDAERLGKLEANLARLGLSAEVVCADAAAAESWSWWDGQAFDRILLDAPCSGSGVIRRHPDIKLLRRPDDIKRAAAQQRQLLSGLWPLLKPGGRLLYVTCSILRRENDAVLAQFLEQQPQAAAQPIAAAWGKPTLHGRQILPGMHGMDGFYYACLAKPVG